MLKEKLLLSSKDEREIFKIMVSNSLSSSKFITYKQFIDAVIMKIVVRKEPNGQTNVKTMLLNEDGKELAASHSNWFSYKQILKHGETEYCLELLSKAEVLNSYKEFEEFENENVWGMDFEKLEALLKQEKDTVNGCLKMDLKYGSSKNLNLSMKFIYTKWEDPSVKKITTTEIINIVNEYSEKNFTSFFIREDSQKVFFIESGRK